ncbi:C2H2-type zinc finger protein [Aspergillus fijiensis CBS 313.89]|uniref:C2H2-type domain-containing protein n=1 Tax=Aspergillus fijiensis CBS 313.89 TaxID=1448319 RepID=A0A8G1RQ33_9EURO|nr:uncharacterized protein BO72DRAFT_131306 [Aspergillus fijiensis CBS 313.89]RAK76572.1 hypothetical protein BO72DRAFT_131306 [Aspergillus fijiensis CBS 313.89]
MPVMLSYTRTYLHGNVAAAWVSLQASLANPWGILFHKLPTVARLIMNLSLINRESSLPQGFEFFVSLSMVGASLRGQFVFVLTMTSVPIGQAEDGHCPAWPQDEVTDLSAYLGTDLFFLPLEGYCDPIVIGDTQGELLAPPSMIMTDTVMGDSREPSWPEQYPNLVAPKNLLSMEGSAESQPLSVNLMETPTLSTVGLDSQVVGGRDDSATCALRFQEAPMPSYDQNVSIVDGLYYCQHRACVTKTGFSTKRDLQKHMRIHFKPVKCPICTVTTAQQIHMRRHFEVHHGGWARQLWRVGAVCKLCGKSFTRTDNLRRHYRTQHEDISSLSVSD